MRNIFLILAAFLLPNHIVVAQNCIYADTDIDGDNLNNGLQEKAASAESCISLCKSLHPAAKYFVWASSELGGLPDYINACWCKANLRESYSKPGAYAGPIECSTDGVCCDIVLLQASPSFGMFQEQPHLLGYYQFEGQYENGLPVYQQVGQNLHLKMFNHHGRWWINDVTGVNQGYIYADGEGCPVDATGWTYYSWASGSWTPDPSVGLLCSDEVVDANNLQCNVNEECNQGCLSLSFYGDTYCCKDCSSGYIEVDPGQLPMCQCS